MRFVREPGAGVGLWVGIAMYGAIGFFGGEGVGKSALRTQLVASEFEPEYVPTTGLGSSHFRTTLGAEPLSLTIYEVGGSPAASEAYTASTLRNCDAVALVFDVTRRHTLDALNTIITALESASYDNDNVVLVANKIDQNGAREVFKSAGEELASKYGWEYVEVSASDNETVCGLLQSIGARMMARYRRLQGEE